MAHHRLRHLEKAYSELIHFSPLVGILGHRQVGKTTFLESRCSNYLTFDDQDTFTEAKRSAKKFIERNSKMNTAIDESQLVPEIFPALKERVRVSKRPGQFILSGSVRFTSKKEIRESLTGRIQYLELLPFTLSELDQSPLSNHLSILFKAKSMENLAIEIGVLKSELARKQKLIEDYRMRGGLPGICFIRKESLRNSKILDQLKTLLDRDLRQVYASKLTFDVLLNFLKEVAASEGQPYSYEKIKKSIGLSPITQKHLLAAFESIFILRKMEIEGDIRAHSYLLEDQAESFFLTEGKLREEQQYMSLLYRNLRSEYFYQIGSSVNVFQFRNRSKAVVPLAFRAADKNLGFLFSRDGSIDRKLKGTAGTFLREYPNSKIIIAHPGDELRVENSRILLCPIACLV